MRAETAALRAELRLARAAHEREIRALRVTVEQQAEAQVLRAPQTGDEAHAIADDEPNGGEVAVPAAPPKRGTRCDWCGATARRAGGADCDCGGADLEAAERLAARRRLQAKVDAVALGALKRDGGVGPTMGAALEVLVRGGTAGVDSAYGSGTDDDGHGDGCETM